MKKIILISLIIGTIYWWDDIKAWRDSPPAKFNSTEQVVTTPKPVEPVASGPSAVTQWLIDHTPKK